MKKINQPITHIGREMMNRRSFLASAASSFSSIALVQLLAEQQMLAADTGLDKSPIRPVVDPRQPNSPRTPHFTAKAKRLIVVFCSGAISHMDTFDYKPTLETYHDKPLPGSMANFKTFQGENGNVHQSPWKFRQRGQCGKMTSDLLPHLGSMVDDMCFIHSLTSKTNTHGPGENFMSTGFTLDGFPSMGAWVSYALGSENRDLPAYVAIPDPRGVPQSSVNNWGPGFLPAAFQGTPFNAKKPIGNLKTPDAFAGKANEDSREYLKLLNERHLEQYPGDTQLAARISSYELAARMQMSVPEVTNLSSEPASIVKMYGADDPQNAVKAGYARNCILARRLIERGVRIVQVFNGAYAMGEGIGNWDGHRAIEAQYNIHGPNLDQPTAALLKDLKQRGLLEDTLFAFVTEFGRMPTFQKGASGRDHNPNGFTVFLTGAGVKSPFSFGKTDDFGHKAVENVVTMYDFHATILHLLGLDHERLSFYHNGIERRLTDVHGHVIRDVLA